MGARERGFTLVETVVAVGISVVLLMAGGVWMLAMRPAALRSAADDFDANLAAARATAGGSGNGATVAFLARVGTPGFIMRVYSGRPTAGGAVTPTNVMDVTSGATVSEATFGAPPFAIFLNSGGYATGTSHYPTVATDGSVTFPVIARQPACPAGGIVVTFANAQGATDKRTLACNTMVGGTSTADPSPTPNVPKVAPSFMLAHWTSDAGPLHFIAAEFGYYHWYASTIGDTCATQSSDTGAAPATFASGWPYSEPSSPNELTLAPVAPAAPYSWPNGDPNDPPALFRLSPVLHNGGLCTARIVDDYNQETDARVQIMGDLQGSATSLTFASPTDASATVTFGKTFDAETLKLQAGATACASVVSVEIPAAPNPQASPSTTPTQATLVVSPIAAGSCTLIVGDQYGEPTLSIPIIVKAAAPLATWPADLVLGANGASVGMTSGLSTDVAMALSPTQAFGPIINALLGGGVAKAGGGPQPCFALALQANGTTPDTSAAAERAQLGIYVDSATGCEVDANDNPLPATSGTPSVGMVAYNASGVTSTYDYSFPSGSCTAASTTGWDPTSANGTQALLRAEGSDAGNCNVTFTGSNLADPSPALDAGLVIVNVTNCTGASETLIKGSCYNVFYTTSPCAGQNGLGEIEYMCNAPPTGSCGGICLVPPEGDYNDLSVGFYYAPVGDEGTYVEYRCAADGTSYFTGNTSTWVQFAHAYWIGGIPNVGAPDPVMNYAVANGLGLDVVGEFNATSMPITWVAHVSPPPCGLQPPPLP